GHGTGGEEGEGPPRGPAGDRRPCEGSRHEPDARAEQARDEEEDRARDLARLPEAEEQELVDGGAVEPVEGWDEEKGHHELGQARTNEELAVLPVLAIGSGGHRDDGDRA